MPSDPARFHSFTRLVLSICEPELASVRTEHCFELRSNDRGAEVWRSSTIVADEGRCESEPRLIGWLTSRQVIELLEEIERSGIYEALPALGLVEGAASSGDDRPRVSMELCSQTSTRQVIDDAPADEATVHDVVVAIREAVAGAQERALTWAG